MKVKNVRWCGVFIGLLTLVLSGCVEDRVIWPPVNQPPVVVPQTQHITLLNMQHDVLRLKIVSGGNTKEAKKLAGKIGFQVGGSVIRKSVRLVEKEKADILLHINPAFQEIDHDGEYYRVDCAIQVQMHAAGSSRIYAQKEFLFNSPRRVLGKEKAYGQFTAPASRKIAGWCEDEIARLWDKEICATILSFQLPTKSDSQNVAAVNINRLSNLIRDISGVISHEFTEYNSETARCSFRVIYLRSQFPQGIGNAISLKLADKKIEKVR